MKRLIPTTFRVIAAVIFLAGVAAGCSRPQVTVNGECFLDIECQKDCRINELCYCGDDFGCHKKILYDFEEDGDVEEFDGEPADFEINPELVEWPDIELPDYEFGDETQNMAVLLAFEARPESPQPLGTTINFYVYAVSQNEILYGYEIEYLGRLPLVLKTNFGDVGSVLQWTPEEPGEYVVRAYVKDSQSGLGYDDYKTLYYTVFDSSDGDYEYEKDDDFDLPDYDNSQCAAACGILAECGFIYMNGLFGSDLAQCLSSCPSWGEDFRNCVAAQISCAALINQCLNGDNPDVDFDYDYETIDYEIIEWDFDRNDFDDRIDLDDRIDYESSPNLIMTNECPLYVSANVGQTGYAQAYIVNYGDATGQIYSAYVNNDYFSVLSPMPGTVYPSATYTVSVAFKPQTPGTVVGVLTINTVSGVYQCNIKGEAYSVTDGDEIDVDDRVDIDKIDYDDYQPSPNLVMVNECPMRIEASVGQEGRAQGLIVNYGDAPGQIYSASFSNPNSYFSILSSLPGTVYPSATYTITIAFRPSSSGTFYNALIVNTVNGTNRCELVGSAYNQPDGDEFDVDDRVDLDEEPYVYICYDACMRIQNCGIASYSECMNLCVNASQAQINCVMATPCDSIISSCLNPADEDDAEPDVPQCTNDVCSSAQYVTFPAANSSYMISGATTSCSNNYSASCANARGPDAVFYFQIYQSVNVEITLSSSGSSMNPVLSLYKDSCPGTEVACNDNYSSTTTDAKITTYLNASTRPTTYFILVDGRGQSGGSYSLTLRNLGTAADGDEIDIDEALPYYCAPACRKLQDCGLIGGSALPYDTYEECLQGCAGGDFGEAVAQCVINTACSNLQSCVYADGDVEEEETTNPAQFELATQCPIYIYSYVGSSAAADVALVNLGGDYGTISSATVINSTGVFAVTSPLPTTVWPGGSGTVTVMFKPSAAGSVSGTLMITTSSGRLTCQVNGMGYNLPDGDEADQDKDELETYADLRLNGSCPLYFKTMAGSSVASEIEVVNYGTASGMIYGVNFTMGTNAFYVENAPPADGLLLPPGGRYAFTVVFSSRYGGLFIDEMQILTSGGILSCGLNGTSVEVPDGDEAEVEAEIEQDLPACNNDTCGVSNYFYLPGAGYSTSFTGTTAGCANDYSSGCSLSPGRDAVYNFHIYDTTKLTITLTSSDGSFTPVLFLRKQVCAGEEAACAQGSSAGTAKLTTVLEPTQYPTNYFIFVDGLGSGAYKLTVASEYILTDGDIEQDAEVIDRPDVDDREPDSDPEPEVEEDSNDMCYAGCKRAVYECAVMSDYATCASWCDQGLFSDEQIQCVNIAACPDMLAKCFGVADGDEESPEVDIEEADKPDVEEIETDRDDAEPEPDKEPDAELEEEQQVEQCYIGCKRLVDECALMSDYAQCQSWCDQGLFSASQIVCINSTPCDDMMAKCFGAVDGDEESAEELEEYEEAPEEIDKDEAFEEIDKDEAVEESPEEVDKDEDVIEEAAEEIDKDEALETDPEPDAEPEMEEEAEEEEDASACPYNTCANAYFIPVSSGVFTDSGDNSSCSDFYQGSCNTNRAPEVVYRFYLPKPTRVVVDLAGSSYDTLLYMQRDACPGSEVACNDDYNQKTSHLDVSLEPGDYYFFVDGYGTNSGAYKLSVNFEAAADSDDDSVPDAIDNCPYIYNPEQWDTDGEGIGDACDNCKYGRNTDQADKDADGLGDVCDPTPDVNGACGLTKCSAVAQCTNYGLNLCQTTVDSWGADVCTKACSASDPCPAPWNCNDGFCACEVPVSCPTVCGKSSQCSSDLPVCADVYGHDSIKECTTDCSSTGKCTNGYDCVSGNCICGTLEPEIPTPPSCPWMSSACYFNGTCTSAYPDYSDVVCNGSIWPPRAGYCTRTCMTNLDCIEVFGADAACNGGTCGCRE